MWASWMQWPAVNKWECGSIASSRSAKTWAVIIGRTHTWQHFSVTISEYILTTKYDFDLRQIASLYWFNGIDNKDTNLSPFTSATNKSLSLPLMCHGEHIRGKIQKVDPKLQRISKAKSSIKSCIRYNYVCVYEVWCRIVSLKSWYLYFLPDTSESTSGLAMKLRNLLDSFTGSRPLTSWLCLLISILITPKCTKLVRMWNRLRIACVLWHRSQVFTALNIVLLPTKPASPVFNVKQNGHCFTVVSAISECWHIKFRHVRCVWHGKSRWQLVKSSAYRRVDVGWTPMVSPRYTTKLLHGPWHDLVGLHGNQHMEPRGMWNAHWQWSHYIYTKQLNWICDSKFGREKQVWN